MGDDRHDMDELRPGEAMGPYDLIAPIGVGGMARVWAARVRGKSDVVAVKMLLPELAENVEFRKMFFDEARIASRVRHPNVCSTFEMGEQAGTLYLAMEWLDGPSLMRVLRPGREDVTECERIPIRPRIAARIVADAAAGLHAAHELVGEDGQPLAVVHRDVSPHNLLMTSTGEVKITDFGVAKAMGKSHMTIAGQLKGKLAYMAPEQLIGGAIDRRCDVFALGCVLYEITTGQRPFQGEFDPQVMASIMMGRYEPPSAIVPWYPHELAIIVMRALANDPGNRFASADQMREALEKYLRGSGPAVGAQQVATLLKDRCGAEIEARGAAVRGERPPAERAPAAAWAAKPKTVAETGSGAMMLDGAPDPSRKGVMWVGIAVLVGASLGVGVLSYVRAARKPKAPVVAVDLTMPTTASTAAAGSNAATASGGASGAASAAAAIDGDPLSRGRVHLRITPSNAFVILDGVVLPRGTETIAKPPNGLTINVLVRADKHEDTIVMVDWATPEEVEVTLVPDPVGQLAPLSMTAPSPPPTVPRTRPASGATGRDGAGASAAAKDAGATPPVIDAPPNPYD